MKRYLALFLLICLTSALAKAQLPQPDTLQTDNGILTIHPIHHATLVLTWNGQNIYVDPTQGAKAFKGIGSPNVIFITHAHGDHMDIKTLKELNTDGVPMVVPQSVAKQLPNEFQDQLVIMKNGDTTGEVGFPVRAIPMYNLPQSPDSYHPKGWGNGYVLTLGGKRVYLSGDTEDIPEMRSLKNIDVAFVCMNLPYTMDVKQAASAVLDFKPRIVYPYHYRGQDIQKFKELVNAKNDKIEVRLRDWYAKIK
ncbi:MAG TPA: MBL fold metallo-hydrolase [Balneolaceae bacterium]|nr:MBL fold metallo-hydrolase [Balneolaceae bacterium]